MVGKAFYKDFHKKYLLIKSIIKYIPLYRSKKASYRGGFLFPRRQAKALSPLRKT